MTLAKISSLAAVAALVPSILLGQMSGSSSKPVGFGVMGGLSLPNGEGSDEIETGFNVSGNVYLRPSATPNLSFRGDLGFDRFAAKISNDLTVSYLSLVANAIYGVGSSSEGSVRPYIIAGAGLYRGKISLNVEGADVSETSTDFGITGGVGLNFKLSGFTVFGEGRIVNVFSEGESSRWIPVAVGIRF